MKITHLDDCQCSLCKDLAKTLRLFDEMEERNKKRNLDGVAHCYPSLKKEE